MSIPRKTIYIYTISKKESNCSKLLHVFFKIHILFCAISGEFSLKTAFVGHSLVSKRKGGLLPWQTVLA